MVRGEPTDLDPNGNPLNDPGTLIIARGSKINALGTPKKPIIFTDLSDDNVRGNPGTIRTTPSITRRSWWAAGVA